MNPNTLAQNGTRILPYLNRQYKRRLLPHGIINWRYLLSEPLSKVRIHRQIWLSAKPARLPLAMYFIMEFFLWARWVMFNAWWRTWLYVQRQGPANGRRKRLQWLRLLRISIAYCIPPYEIVAFQLDRRDAENQIWDYVYTHEVPAFHRWRSRKALKDPSSMQLLQDKLRFKRLMETHAVPSTPIVALLSAGSKPVPGDFTQTGTLYFCKPCYGSAGRDCFVIRTNGSGEKPAVFTTRNGRMATPCDWHRLVQAVDREDFLVQPFLENHPGLGDLIRGNDAITVRLITEHHPEDGQRCYCGLLEIPDDRTNGHIILPIDLCSGRVASFSFHRLPESVRRHAIAMASRMDQYAIPFWDQLKQNAFKAHACFPDVYAIAWDFIITRHGPCILEGNAGWGTLTPQMFHDRLLANEEI